MEGKANYAARMYHRVGFEIVDENAEEYIMVKRLVERANSDTNRKDQGNLPGPSLLENVI